MKYLWLFGELLILGVAIAVVVGWGTTHALGFPLWLRFCSNFVAGSLIAVQIRELWKGLHDLWW